MTTSSEYFPTSKRSSISSSSSLLPELDGPVPPVNRTGTGASATPSSSAVSLAAAASPTSAARVDPLSRDFPKPAREPTLEEMLARPPQKWSLGHYVKHAREARVPVPDKEAQARAFAETKQQLLKAREELSQLESRGA
jgi:hypothetical protein